MKLEAVSFHFFFIRASRFHVSFDVFQALRTRTFFFQCSLLLFDDAAFVGENHMGNLFPPPDVHLRFEVVCQEGGKKTGKAHAIRFIKREHRRTDEHRNGDDDGGKHFEDEIGQNGGAERDEHDEKLAHGDGPQYLILHIDELRNLELLHKGS